VKGTYGPVKVAFGGGAVFALLALLALLGGSGTQARAAARAAPSPVDVEIAIDGTGSMTDAIARAQSQAQAMSEQAKQLLQDIRFSVVTFRNPKATLPEYQLLQSFTSDTTKVKAALNQIKANRPGPPGPASYSLAFHNSYSDARMGWRPTARKIVVVLGDAEPYAAGSAGLAGCKNHLKDPDGLAAPTELAHMRAAQRTLIMVRVHSSQLTTTLQCYQSLAAGAYVGGAARDEGSNLAAVIVELIEHAYAPVTLTPDVRLALRSGRDGYTLTLHNPNVLPVTTSSISLVLPAKGFRYVPGTTTGITRSNPVQSGRTLRWAIARTVAAHGKARLHVVVRAPRRLGAYRGTASAQIQTAAGNNLTSRALGGAMRVKRGLKGLTFRFSGSTASRATLRGSAAGRFRHRVRRLPAGTRARGSVVLVGQGTRVVLQVRALRLMQFAAPSRARLSLRVASARGLSNCSVGTGGKLLVVDSGALRANDLTADSLVLSLPRACGGSGLQTTNVAVSAR
jgi:hypothetical protein